MGLGFGLGVLNGCSAGGGSSSGTPPVAVTLSVSAASLTFASTAVGSTSAAQTVTLTAGASAVTISGVTLAGTNASSFSQTSGCVGTLAAGTSCMISVNFTPTAAGALSGSVTIADNASGSPQAVSLSGTGAALAPVATLSSATISFGNQTVGAAAASQTVTVSNTGNGPLIFASVVLTPSGTPFTLSGTCLGGTSVAVGGSCTVVVGYAPTMTGAQTATVNLTDNAAPSPQTIAVSGTAYTGLSVPVAVFAGTTPVVGATVQLYAAGTTGNGSGASALLSSPVVTGAGGAATISGYNCPAAASPVYLVSRGGTVGSGAVNAGLVMMTAVGLCSQLTPGRVVTVNEATTVAAVVALAPFYTAGGGIGASATNATGLANAFATAAELANPATSRAPGLTLPGNAVAPTDRIDSLANAVNGCAVTVSACSAFFTAATVNSTAPTNTLDAVYNVVRQPANNVAGVFASSQASTVYTPFLQFPPTDWTFFLTLSGGGLNGPSGLGVDSTGNAWVASYFSVATKFNPLGGTTFANGVTGGGLNNSYGLAMDLKDNAWVPNEQPASASGTGSVSEFSSAGASVAGPAGYTAGGMNYPISVAIDPNQTAWVVQYGNSHLTLLTPAGVPLSGSSGYTSDKFAFPVAIAVDGNHAGWIANQSGTMVTKASADGTSFVNYNCCNGASGVAIDQGNNVWVANFYGASVSLISNAGTVVSNGTYTGAGGLDHPQGVAIDGAGNVWVANFRQPYLTELTGTTSATPGTSLTPKTGYGADAGLLEAYAIAVDASGSLWVSNFGSNTVTKFLGLATPVKTPISGAAQIP